MEENTTTYKENYSHMFGLQQRVYGGSVPLSDLQACFLFIQSQISVNGFFTGRLNKDFHIRYLRSLILN